MVYGKINKPFWDDRPVAVIGGGPSLIDFDFEKLRGAHVLAVKGAIFGVPWADACFGLGLECFKEWRDRLANLQSRVYWALPEDQLAQLETPSPKNITFLKRLHGQNLPDNPSEVYGGGTAGFGSLQVCIHKRARQIILFGFDYDQSAAHWREWAEHFAIYSPYFAAHGITVMNACPTSSIRCFQKVSLRDAVDALRSKMVA